MPSRSADIRPGVAPRGAHFECCRTLFDSCPPGGLVERRHCLGLRRRSILACVPASHGADRAWATATRCSAVRSSAMPSVDCAMRTTSPPPRSESAIYLLPGRHGGQPWSPRAPPHRHELHRRRHRHPRGCGSSRVGAQTSRTGPRGGLVTRRKRRKRRVARYCRAHRLSDLAWRGACTGSRWARSFDGRPTSLSSATIAPALSRRLRTGTAMRCRRRTRGAGPADAPDHGSNRGAVHEPLDSSPRGAFRRPPQVPRVTVPVRAWTARQLALARHVQRTVPPVARHAPRRPPAARRSWPCLGAGLGAATPGPNPRQSMAARKSRANTALRA